MPPKSTAAEREARRYVFDTPVPASLNRVSISIVNASDRGLQLAHPQPLKASSICRISVPLPSSSHRVEFEGQIVWTQMAMAGAEGKGIFSYVSGVKLDGTAENAAMVHLIITAYPGRYDDGTVEKRGQTRPIMRLVKTPQRAIDPDRLLLIRQVNDRLNLAPEEQKVLAARARSALSIRIASVTQSDNELAVWEYLQHVISLDDIHTALS